ncbi:MAG: ComEC/Rec2 family competence protein [Anaerolineales bacterium]|nr:ComEC/Rec2 family competence protein [Anaerolineales bacterium]
MPLLWLSLAFLCGVLLGEWLGWLPSAWLGLAALVLALEILRQIFKRFAPAHLAQYASRARGYLSRLTDRCPRAPACLVSPISYPILLIALFLGGARYQSSLPEITPGFIAWYNDQEVRYVVEGVLVDMQDERDTYSNLRLEVDQIHPAGELLFTPVEGLLLARVLPCGDWRYGDRVRLEGYLRTPFENEEFSYRDYLARQGVYATLSCRYAGCAQRLLRGQGNPLLAAIYALRQRSLAVVYQVFPDPEASLMAGILLGIESGIPEEVARAFRDTGTAHIIAISGFNFAIVAGLFAVGFNRLLGRWRGMLAAFLGIAIYTILAGANAAVVRAAIMGGLSVFARQMGRRQHGLNTLAFVAAVMALFDPHVLWDVGFQLSFMATLGLMLYAEPMSEAFTRWATPRLGGQTARRLAGPVGEYFLFTLAAQITTLPLVLYYFQRLSLISFVANPLILPAQPPVMVLGGLAVMLGLAYLPLGRAAAYLVWPFIAYTIRVVEWMAGAPGASLALGRVGLLAVLAFYAALFAGTWAGPRLRAWLKARRRSLPSGVAVTALLVLALLAVFVWQAALSAPDGRLHLNLLDVGSGDGLLIQTPTGRYLLVDGGPSPSRLSDALGRRLPLANRELDWLVVAAAGEEQLAALPGTLERFPPANVLWSGSTAGVYSARQLRSYLAQAQIPATRAQAGQTLDLGQGAVLRVLAVNRRGAVLLLEWGRFRVLLPVGLDFESMQALMEAPDAGPVTALLLAEGGYAPLNTPEWVERWRPQVILLSVAADDPDGRPDPETLAAIAGYRVLRTDHNGWVRLSTDGESLWVEVEQR